MKFHIKYFDKVNVRIEEITLDGERSTKIGKHIIFSVSYVT